MDRVRNQIAIKNFTKSDVENAMNLMRLRDDFIRGKATWDDFQSAASRLKDAKWIQLVPLPRSPDGPQIEIMRHLPIDYDPVPILGRVRVPVLALFGELDLNVVADKNSAIWDSALRNGGNKSYTIKILKNARHGLLEVRTGSDDEVPFVKRVVPDYQTSLIEWLSMHGFRSGMTSVSQSASPLLP
jgi:hypothetical protein